MARPPSLRLPGRILLPALAGGIARAAAEDWRASPIGRALAGSPRAEGFHIAPRDFRPPDPEAGRRILSGGFVLAGASLATGVRGDPWDRPSPSRGFAEALHRFDWLPDLMAAGPDGAAEALRLTLDWRRVFGRWNAFSWAPAIMARRVFHLACAGPALAARASEAETAHIAGDLLRQARALLDAGDVADAAERAACAAVAGAALRGPASRKLLERALRRLAVALPATLDADGGHRSRRPDAALELLFDLQTLEEALGQRGLSGPEALPRAIDRLAAAVRVLTLADGTLATFHGGAPRTPSYVAAARAQDETGDRATGSGVSGFERMDARTLQVVADVAPPPSGPWSASACAHPLSLLVLAGGRRLIEAGVGRPIEAGSTVHVGERPFGQILSGFLGQALGPRLVDADLVVDAQRHEAPGAVWLDLAHQGWLRRYGLLHQRRLYLDTGAGELRGEDRLTPTRKAQGPDGRHFVPYAVRFQLAAGVSVMVSQDHRSVLLRRDGEAAGWVLRNDVLDFTVEPSPRPGRPGQQLVLRGQRRADSGARVRWKLAPAAS